MMRDGLYILGTCSGTEPMPKRHHTSFVLSISDRLYWFDAGECCSYTAHMMGINLCNVQAVFISHSHMDHIGGLGNLFWTIRKVNGFSHALDGKSIDLFMPNDETWQLQLSLLKQTEGGFTIPFTILEHRIEDGVILDDGQIQVKALHNMHLPQNDLGKHVSFSFAMDVKGMHIAYSGDVRTYNEIAPLLRDAHVILAETGHHTPRQVCAALNEMGIRPERLLFLHHGRAILNDENISMKDARSIYDGQMDVLSDGMLIPFNTILKR